MTAGSPFLLTSAEDDAESHVWPLVAALGEQQTKAATLLSALAEQQQKSRDLEQQLEAARGGLPVAMEGSASSNGRVAELESTVAALQSELAETLDALNEVESVGSADLNETRRALESMTAERDQALAQVAEANAALAAARAEIAAERERAVKRAEAGRAALANRRGKDAGETPARTKSAEGAPAPTTAAARRREDLTDEGFFDGRGSSPPDTKDRPPRRVRKCCRRCRGCPGEGARRPTRPTARELAGKSPDQTPTFEHDAPCAPFIVSCICVRCPG